MDPHLVSLLDVITRTDEVARSGAVTTKVWKTDMGLLDEFLDGGLRSGNLVLLAGPQGQGKTTLALQLARNAARAGQQVVYFCFEHDPEVLLERLIAMEAGEIAEDRGPSQKAIRQAFEDTTPTPGGLHERLAKLTYGVEALRAVESYQDRLHIHRSTGNSTSIGVIAGAVDDVRKHTGTPPMVVVDYLQKVFVPQGVGIEDERVTLVVEDLKDLAIEHGVPVLAITAADKGGLTSGKRMRAQHLRGSTALAYEADVLLVINSKYDLVSRQTLMYTVGGADKYKQWVVLTIEKNRNGRAGIDLEYRKRFDQNRFEPNAQLVTDQLVDDRMIIE